MTSENVVCETIYQDKEPIYFTGPSYKEGPLPALFYFALSGYESLNLKPINQIVTLIEKKTIRIYSLTIPGHDMSHIDNNSQHNYHIKAKSWASEFAKNPDSITQFITNAKKQIDFLIYKKMIDPKHIAVAGLSRGAFIAAHLAALDKRIRALLGFAPMTKLSSLGKFDAFQNDHADSLSLHNIADNLTHCATRFYIGNRDVRVGTDNAFQFICKLAEAYHKKKIRTLNAELFITPSIGYNGHGTSIATFTDGAKWIEQYLK